MNLNMNEILKPKVDRLSITSKANEYVERSKKLSNIRINGLPTPPPPKEEAEGVTIFTEWDIVKKRHGGISNIPFNILGEYLDRWTGLVAYARWKEAIEDVELTTAKEIRDMLKKQLYLIQDGSREQRDAAVYGEPTFIEWEERFLNMYAKYEITKSLRDGYEQIANAISREITRRGSDLTDTRRSINRGGGV